MTLTFWSWTGVVGRVCGVAATIRRNKNSPWYTMWTHSDVVVADEVARWWVTVVVVAA